MTHGGRRSGAGRPLGGHNRSTGTFREAASAYDAEGLETLASIMRNKEMEPSDRMTAIAMLMDRAHGKPTAIMEATVKAVDPEQLSDAELAAYLVAGPNGAGDHPAPPDQDEFDAVVPPRRLRTGKAPKAPPKKTQRRRNRKD